MLRKAILLLLVAAALTGCKVIGYDESATATDIQGTWTMERVSGSLCCAGILEYTFEGDYDYYTSTTDYSTGTVDCSNGVFFDYEFDNNLSMITISGSTAAGGGLVDGSYYVYLNGDKMAWEFEAENPLVTAYVFGR